MLFNMTIIFLNQIFTKFKNDLDKILILIKKLGNETVIEDIPRIKRIIMSEFNRRLSSGGGKNEPQFPEITNNYNGIIKTEADKIDNKISAIINKLKELIQFNIRTKKKRKKERKEERKKDAVYRLEELESPVLNSHYKIKKILNIMLKLLIHNRGEEHELPSLMNSIYQDIIEKFDEYNMRLISPHAKILYDFTETLFFKTMDFTEEETEVDPNDEMEFPQSLIQLANLPPGQSSAIAFGQESASSAIAFGQESASSAIAFGQESASSASVYDPLTDTKQSAIEEYELSSKKMATIENLSNLVNTQI